MVEPAQTTKSGPGNVSISRLHISTERTRDLISTVRRRAHLVNEFDAVWAWKFDGCLGLEVRQSKPQPREIPMVSRGRHRDAFERDMKGDVDRVWRAE